MRFRYLLTVTSLFYCVIITIQC